MLAEKLPERYLILVDPIKNNNKFYKMVDNGNGQWTAQYGRVGNGTPQKRTYPDSLYRTKLREKLAKGYKDVTELHTVSEASKEEIFFTDITDAKVAEFINRLMMFAKHTIKSNYTVNAADVTQKMVDEARNVIRRLRKILESDLPEQTLVIEFNSTVTELMHVIPRRINGTGEGGVKRMLASKKRLRRHYPTRRRFTGCYGKPGNHS